MLKVNYNWVCLTIQLLDSRIIFENSITVIIIIITRTASDFRFDEFQFNEFYFINKKKNINYITSCPCITNYELFL